MQFIVDDSYGNITILRSMNERYINGKNEFLYISIKRDKIHQARSYLPHESLLAGDNDFVIEDLKYPYMVDINFKRNVYDIINELFGNKKNLRNKKQDGV